MTGLVEEKRNSPSFHFEKLHKTALTCLFRERRAKKEPLDISKSRRKKVAKTRRTEKSTLHAAEDGVSTHSSRKVELGGDDAVVVWEEGSSVCQEYDADNHRPDSTAWRRKRNDLERCCYLCDSWHSDVYSHNSSSPPPWRLEILAVVRRCGRPCVSWETRHFVATAVLTKIADFVQSNPKK